MKGLQVLKSALVCGASVLTLVHPVAAKEFDVPDGDLSAALVAYMKQTDVELVYADDTVRGHRSRGARGDYTETAALTRILQGTGFTAQPVSNNAIGIVPAPQPVEVAQAAPRRAPAPAPAQAGVETVVVTAQHKAEDIQQVPIAVTALSQQQLTERQIAGGPDLIRDVPNMNFTKTNFTGYNIELRGIGTQAISVTTDPAVAVAFSDVPFIRNHFFEQEFYDLQDVEVLRGPQGTLYGRNATAGVVNLKSALPTDQYEAMLSADLGNYSNRRLEAMLNIPIVGDKLDIRFAGEWTKRDGYSFNETTGQPIDGRDLWSGRMSIGWKPDQDLQVNLVWEHFQESDNRLRSGKQLCKTDYGPGGTPTSTTLNIGGTIFRTDSGSAFIQGCVPASLYSPESFETPNGLSLPYIQGLQAESNGNNINPYGTTVQSSNLRDVNSGLNPAYNAKNDVVELNVNYAITPALTFTSQTGFGQDFLFSTEDYNRFGAAPGLFRYAGDGVHAQFNGVLPDPNGLGLGPGNAYCKVGVDVPCTPVGYFCDPQVGCSDKLILEDLSEERSWQISQEFRLASNFSGPLNFSAGGNYLHYETDENYYVFGNVLTLIDGGFVNGNFDSNTASPLPLGYQYNDPHHYASISRGYVDPNPISNLNGNGHNYFRSNNPYVLNSYAIFGETYYNVTDELKLVGGLRWTDDEKHFVDVPSWLVTSGIGYPVFGIVDQKWDKLTGRAVADWTPKLDFTDQTLIYTSYAHGYKAGGANPPGAIFTSQVQEAGNNDVSAQPTHPLTFKPEFIDAYELGTKNTLLDGALTLNGDIFFYNYTGYQISQIVDRTAINLNYNATVKGAEIESSWEPAPGLKFSFSGGYEDARADNGQSAVDLIDRTAGTPGWVVMKPFANEASNCIFPTYVAAHLSNVGAPATGGFVASYCTLAYILHLDPVTGLPYVPNPTITSQQNGYGGAPVPAGYPGFNPLTAPNGGTGFSKNISGNELPNAPHLTTSLSAEYTMPVSQDWAATLHGDFYWQSQSWARIINDNPYDKIRGYSNVNLSLILNSANGWQVMGYVKNVFNVTAITGDFLNSDDSGLTTNIFLTDPRLYGVRVTKHLDEGDGFWGSDWSGADWIKDIFADSDNGKPPLWIELGGQLERVESARDILTPPFFEKASPTVLAPMVNAQLQPHYAVGEEAKLTFSPDDSSWVFSAAIRYGRSNANRHLHYQSKHPTVPFTSRGNIVTAPVTHFDKFGDGQSQLKSSHSILDFQAGKDVGLGMFGAEEGSSVISGGVRIAQFTSSLGGTLHARPVYASLPAFGIPGVYTFRSRDVTNNTAVIESKRSTHAVGPTISWDASAPIAGNTSDGTIALDWGVNAGVLFGRQRAAVRHQTSGAHFHGFLAGGYSSYAKVSSYAHGPYEHNRSRSVTIPNIGGFAGLSMKYQNAKVSFGYRVDTFFNAMDTGIDVAKSSNLTFHGPYATISFGLGG